MIIDATITPTALKKLSGTYLRAKKNETEDKINTPTENIIVVIDKFNNVSSDKRKRKNTDFAATNLMIKTVDIKIAKKTKSVFDISRRSSLAKTTFEEIPLSQVFTIDVLKDDKRLLII